VVASACAAALVLGKASAAMAWYFPEHVVIAHDAVMQLPDAIRGVLEDAVARARTEGLPLCARIDRPFEEVAQRRMLETRMIKASISVDCVPYAALSALAGDHANSAAELRGVLVGGKGVEITSAAAYEWVRFEEALQRLPNDSLERMSFVHALDVALYFIDPGYELRAQATHAHFGDAGRPIGDVLRAAATQGDVDNALGQFLAHHLRSLALARAGSVSEALLEHGFAMHFFQDAFAAGHLVMTSEAWRIGNPAARRRHDFYNAKGLEVGRAMSAEPCSTLGAGSLELSGLTPCWVTSGDGYLGTSPDASDRLHAARAAAKVDLEFALAIDASRVVAAAEVLGEREQIALGQLIEPVPWWTVPAPQRRGLHSSASRTLTLLRAAAEAIERLRAAGPMPPVAIGAPSRRDLFEPTSLDDVVQPCKARGEVAPSFADEGDLAPCGPASALGIGTVGVSLLRPLLVEWPAPTVPASTLLGESKEDLGWAAQLLAAASATTLAAPHAPVTFLAPAVGVSAGLSYRWGTYLPGRLDRSLVEANAGISVALQYDSRGSTGASSHVTFLDQELRWPVLWELLTSYRLPLDLAQGHEAGRVVLLGGARAHEIVTNPTPVFWGVELEAAAIALSRGHGAYPLYTSSPELRLYVGAANSQATQPSFPPGWGLTLGLELTGGYATLF
jgi:hypothetical protein